MIDRAEFEKAALKRYTTHMAYQNSLAKDIDPVADAAFSVSRAYAEVAYRRADEVYGNLVRRAVIGEEIG